MPITSPAGALASSCATSAMVATSGHPNGGCPLSMHPSLSDYTVRLRDIKLTANVSPVDADGTSIISLTVPAKYRQGNDIFLPVSLSPGIRARTSLSNSSSPSQIDVVGDGIGDDYAPEFDAGDPCDTRSSSPIPIGENMVRILPQNTAFGTFDLPGFHALPNHTSNVQPASAVSVLTEPLPHGSTSMATAMVLPHQHYHHSAMPVMFGMNPVGNQQDGGMIGVETPVLRCTAQPLYIPNSRSSSTIASHSASNVVGSSTSSGCISVLSSPSLGSVMGYAHQADGSPGSNSSRPSPRPHTCYVCNEGHATAAALYTHMETAHNEKLKNLFTCEKCGASFLRRYRYHEHVHAYHTGDGERQFVCDYPDCGKKYRYRRHLRRHVRIHGDVNEFRRHECDICGKRFPRVSQRDEHRNIHTGEKPFVCEICGSSYSHSSTLWLHRKRHENGKIDDKGQPIGSTSGRDEEQDEIDVLNDSSDPSWHATGMMSAADGHELASGDVASAATGVAHSQSVIVQSVDALDNSAQVLVSYSDSDLLP